MPNTDKLNSTTAANNNIGKKIYLSKTFSVNGDAEQMMNNHYLSESNTNKGLLEIKIPNKQNLKFIYLLERTPVHQTMSLNADIENAGTNQQMSKVKMRDNSAKKKKGLRELKSRISLPPELKSGFSNRTNNNTNYQTNESNNIRSKLAQRSSYYQATSASVQALNDPLNQSIASSSLQLSPHFSTNTGGPLSRNEHRQSMLDLGFGKIESYVKLDKLGEGIYKKIQNFLYKFNHLWFFLKALMLPFIKGHLICLLVMLH